MAPRDRLAPLLTLLLVVAATSARLVPHPWNCTPILAVALFAGARLRRRWAVVVALGALAAGDLALGAFPYGGMEWVYGCIAVVALLGGLLRRRPGVGATLAAVLGGGLFFYGVTNFGVWLGPLYPHTRTGLVACYVAALPFYRNQVIGDLLYSGALFGLYALAMRTARRERADHAGA